MSKQEAISLLWERYTEERDSIIRELSNQYSCPHRSLASYQKARTATLTLPERIITALEQNYIAARRAGFSDATIAQHLGISFDDLDAWCIRTKARKLACNAAATKGKRLVKINRTGNYDSNFAYAYTIALQVLEFHEKRFDVDNETFFWLIERVANRLTIKDLKEPHKKNYTWKSFRLGIRQLIKPKAFSADDREKIF